MATKKVALKAADLMFDEETGELLILIAGTQLKVKMIQADVDAIIAGLAGGKTISDLVDAATALKATADAASLSTLIAKGNGETAEFGKTNTFAVGGGGTILLPVIQAGDVGKCLRVAVLDGAGELVLQAPALTRINTSNQAGTLTFLAAEAGFANVILYAISTTRYIIVSGFATLDISEDLA